MSAERKATLVFIPFPILSHQAAAVQTAKLLVDRHEHLSVTIIVMKLPIDTKIGSHSENKPRDEDDDPRISFVELPQDQSSFAKWGKSPNSFIVHYIDSQKGPVRDAVAKTISGSNSRKIAGFVVDMFCTAMIDVADELNAPSYVFFTCSGATLGLFFHLQGLADEKSQDLAEYEDSDVAISVPTYANPVPAKVWPSLVFEKNSCFFSFTRRFRETKGILINTFLEFESHAIKSLSDDEKIPQVFPVGPMIRSGGEETSDRERQKHDEIINWLDEQPDSSVVFLCFGSNGCFERDQLNEIAVALENSGLRFLWSLRKPPPKGKLEFPGEYENPGEMLPDGFSERTVGIGKVIGWAPQMAILSHPAVGGFISHCGWNSTLESVWCNVPMATWPLAAEQQANAFQLVKEFEMAVEIKMDYRKDCNVIVPAEKIEKAIRELMDPDNQGRAKVKTLSETSRVVMTKGGSSYDFLGCFMEDVLGHVL